MGETAIDRFLRADSFAVAGASSNRAKYGNKVLRSYLQNEKHVVALHPTESDVEGAPTFAKLADVPHAIESLSIVTPPPVTRKIVADAIDHGVKRIWMQPGAEDAEAIAAAEAAGIEVIAQGPCVLVAMHYRES